MDEDEWRPKPWVLPAPKKFSRVYVDIFHAIHWVGSEGGKTEFNVNDQSALDAAIIKVTEGIVAGKIDFISNQIGALDKLEATAFANIRGYIFHAPVSELPALVLRVNPINYDFNSAPTPEWVEHRDPVSDQEAQSVADLTIGLAGDCIIKDGKIQYSNIQVKADDVLALWPFTSDRSIPTDKVPTSKKEAVRTILQEKNLPSKPAPPKRVREEMLTTIRERFPAYAPASENALKQILKQMK